MKFLKQKVAIRKMIFRQHSAITKHLTNVKSVIIPLFLYISYKPDIYILFILIHNNLSIDNPNMRHPININVEKAFVSSSYEIGF